MTAVVLVVPAVPVVLVWVLGMNLLETLLADSTFAESVSVTPYGSTATTTGISVRIDRQSSAVTQHNDVLETEIHAQVKVLDSVHATYKGLVSPVVGDNWTIAEKIGGTGVSGWIAGKALGRNGWWEIPVIYRTRLEVGKTRKKD